MGEVLDVKNVIVQRNGNAILNDVTWRVNDGERWVILGANGAGKTTLISIASGRMQPTSGDVAIVGERLDSADMAEMKALVGVASSAVDAKISARETVLDVVRTAAYGKTTAWNERYEDEDTERALGLLATLGVAHAADRTFGSLSSGERKRVGIARALMSDPEILVLDEPASGLDFAGREKLLETLSDLAQAVYAPVMVLVTHHMEEIPAGFTHALLMKDGKVFAAGEISSVLTDVNISDAFGIPARIEHVNGRYFATSRR